MKNKHLYKVSLAAALIGVSLSFSSCGKDDDSSSSNSNGNTQEQTTDSEVKLVSELKCTVAEFATKYTTLKKGEKVSVTLTDVSDNNLPQVAAVLQKMSGTKLSKAGGDGYIVVLVMESKDELTKIPAEIFKDCSAIATITIPDCVELIESGAFDGCTALEAVKILSEVAVIQEGAFAENVKVEGGTQTEVVVKPEIKLLTPADIVDFVNASDEEIVTLNMPLETYDHTDVMVEISKITDKKVKLVIPEGVDVLGMDSDKFPKDEIYGRIYPKPSALVSVGIPESVTEIGNRAFYSCDGLISITIPSSCKSIGEFAFQSCKGLTSISIPSSCKSIGNFAFNGCFGLEDLSISNGVEKIGPNSFAFCYRIKNVIIPESVTEIGEHAFHGCEGITDIIIPEEVDMISYGTFQGCSKLVSVTINSDFTMIASDAFAWCDNLQTIYCTQAVYDKYHKTFPQMRVEGVDNSYTQITFHKQYGAMNFTPEDDYESVVFEFEEVPSDVQITFTSDLFEKEETWGNSYYAAYYPVQYYINGNTIELNLDQVFGTEFADLENGIGERANKITTIAIQNAAEGENVVYLKRVVFRKTDGSDVVLKNSEEGFDFEIEVIE